MTPKLKPESTSLRACSACAGDYEDPERTVWSDGIEEQGEEEGEEDASAGNAKQSASREGFPAWDL